MRHAELRWQCRRGMRELDILLERWLALHYGQQDDAQKSAFRRLLTLPDPDLARYLLAGEKPEEPELARVVDSIRGGAPD